MQASSFDDEGSENKAPSLYCCYLIVDSDREPAPPPQPLKAVSLNWVSLCGSHDKESACLY